MMNFKKIAIDGLILAVPLAIIAYVFTKITIFFKKIITPFATHLGIHNILGEFTLIILAVLLIIGLILVLGLLMQFDFVTRICTRLENVLIRFFPILNYLKVLASDTLDLENEQNTWKPIIVKFENKYNPAFIVEEDEKYISLFICLTNKINDGKLLTTEKKNVEIIPSTLANLMTLSKSFGKGLISVIPKNS